ncbi:2-hydroxyacid dehydrogenase, partial [Clarias magur]
AHVNRSWNTTRTSTLGFPDLAFVLDAVSQQYPRMSMRNSYNASNPALTDTTASIKTHGSSPRITFHIHDRISTIICQSQSKELKAPSSSCFPFASPSSSPFQQQIQGPLLPLKLKAIKCIKI